MRANKNRKKLIIVIAAGMIPAFGIINMINTQNAQIANLNQQLSQAQAQAQANSNAAPAAMPQEDTNTTTVLAKTNIKAGEVITSDKIEITQYRKTDLPQNYFNNQNFVLGKVASQNIFQGKIITNEDLINVDPNLLNIPPGMRAITIPSTYFQGLASYMFVGAKIDLISIPNKGSPQFIAQNVKIISLEEAMDASNTANPPAVPAPTSSGSPGAQANSNQANSAQQPTPMPSPSMLQASGTKTNTSANKAAAITVLIPLNIADSVVNAMINGKLQVVTRGSNDNKIIHKRTISSIESVPKLNLPPPPTLSTKLPSLPGPNIDDTFDEPKSKIEVYTGKTKNTTCFDNNNKEMVCTTTTRTSSSAGSLASSSSLPPAPPSKSLSDLLKSIK